MEIELSETVKRVHQTLGYYPARFPFYLTGWLLSRLSEETPRGTILDPFVGSGVTCSFARAFGLQCIGMDINPYGILVARLGSALLGEINLENLESLLGGLRHASGFRWLPEWRRLDYWHPPVVLEDLSILWGYLHALDGSWGLARDLLMLLLARATRRLSYADPQIPKLYRGRGPKRLAMLLARNTPRELALREVERRLRSYISATMRLARYVPLGAPAPTLLWRDARSGPPVNTRVDIVFTSPPYLAAHEYSRSTKLELYWLGYSEDDVSSVKKREIPYANTPQHPVESATYKRFREMIPAKRRKIYDRYFQAIALAFDKALEARPSKLAIVVGPATLGGRKVPICSILYEHLRARGFNLALYFINTIQKRKLFNYRNNKNPNGITNENILVLEEK